MECSGSTPVDTGGAGIDGGSLLGSPPGSLPSLMRSARRRERRFNEMERGAERRAAAQRPKPHDLQNLITSGYLERLGFDYKPATAATMFRNPSKLGMTP
jgi:phospholipase C